MFERFLALHIDQRLNQHPSCPKLRSYWQFYSCGYHKGSNTCAEPDHIDSCPVPSHPLRNGRLNQLAYSLFLFVRDIADGDLVGWIDGQLSDTAKDHVDGDGLGLLRETVIGPLRNVYGVSDKVLSMMLSHLLIGAGRGRAG